MKTSNLILLALAAFFSLSMIYDVATAKVELPANVELTGRTATRTYDGLPLKHLNIEGQIKVILTAGIPNVEVTADEGWFETLVDQDDDPERLSLVLPKGAKAQGIVARVSSPVLERVTLSGSPRLESPEPLPYSDFELRGAGSINSDLRFSNAERIEFQGSGGGTATFSGTTARFEASTSGGITVEATDLQAQDVVVNASGGNTFKVRAEQSIQAQGSGSTTVRYLGSPRVSSSGSGNMSVEAM